MKKETFFLLLIGIFTSCSNEENINSTPTTKEIISKQTRSVGDGKYDALGYGYNCFYSDFSDPVYVQAKVINIERLKQGKGKDQRTNKEVTFNPTDISEAILHGRTESRVAYGTSISKLTEKLHVNVKTSLGTKILKLFSLDLEATVDKNSTHNSLNSFYRVDALKTTRRLTLPYTSPSKLRYFVTDEFLIDQNYLTIEDYIKKYGTHVMTDILLGGKFSAFYTGNYESTNQHSEQEFKAESNFLLSSVKAGVKYDRTLFQSFKRVNIYIKTLGGTTSSNAIISQSPDGTLDNVSVDYTGWINSVTQESEALIGIGNPDTEIYLLSEFVDNIIIKKEIEGYMGNEKPTYILSSINNNLSPKDIGLLARTINNTFGLIPIHSTQNFARAAIYLIKEGEFYRIKHQDKYLDSSAQLTSFQKNNKQLWNIELSPNNSTQISLKNVDTGLYLFANDGKFHERSADNEENIYWDLFAINVNGITEYYANYPRSIKQTL